MRRGGAGDAVMAMCVGQIDEVLFDDDHGQLLEPPLVDLHRLPKPALRLASVPVVVDQHVVDESVADVLEEGLEVFCRGVVPRLARLGGDVADVHPHPRRGGQRVTDVADQEVGKDAREEAAWTDDDHVRFQDPFQRLGIGADVRRLDEDALDRLFRVADTHLTVQALARREARGQVKRHAGGRQHLATHRQHAVRLPNGLLEVAGHRGHRGDEQVAEGVLVEP